MLIAKPTCLLVGNEDGDVALVLDVLLRLWPGSLNGYEDIVLAEDVPSFIVYLLIDTHKT